MKFRNDLAIGGNVSAQTNVTPQTQARTDHYMMRINN